LTFTCFSSPQQRWVPNSTWDNERTFQSTHNTLCFVRYDTSAYITPMYHGRPKKLLTLQQNFSSRQQTWTPNSTWDNEWTFQSTHNTLCFAGYDIGAYIAPMSHTRPKTLLTLQQNICTNNLGNFRLSHVCNIYAQKICFRFVHTNVGQFLPTCWKLALIFNLVLNGNWWWKPPWTLEWRFSLEVKIV
jgi:hypothetical protein